MDRIEVRTTVIGEAPDLARLIAAFRDHLQAEVPADRDIEVQLPRALADPSIEFACAWLDGGAVGYTQLRFLVSLWGPGLEAHLEDLFVLPAARRRSVGRALLRHTLDRARSRGAARITLNTNDRNDSAQALYRSEGFAPVSHAVYPDSREVLWGRKVGAA